jgi:hypothetical protein
VFENVTLLACAVVIVDMIKINSVIENKTVLIVGAMIIFFTGKYCRDTTRPEF